VSSRVLGSRLGLAGLAAFLVADVALVGLALRSTQAGAEPAGGRPGARGGISAAGARTTTPAPAESASAPVGPAQGPLTVGIVAVDADTAWRFTAGTCADGGSTLSITSDGGATWEPRAVPFDATMRIRVRDDGTAFAIGSDAECSPRFRQAERDAAQWGAESAVPQAWYRDPKNPAVIGTAAGTRAKPCGASAVLDLSVVDDAAQALCADGRVRASDIGATWAAAGDVAGALAIAATAQSTLAVRAADGCEGLAVVDARAPDTVVGCAEVDAAELEPGSVSLSVKDGHAWLLAGDAVLRSSGDLSEWARAG
jgi:hypothetical protein